MDNGHEAEQLLIKGAGDRSTWGAIELALHGLACCKDAEIEQLRAALRPFAKIADEVKAVHPGWYHDGFSFEVLGDRMTLAPFRAASAALAQTKGHGQGDHE